MLTRARHAGLALHALWSLRRASHRLVWQEARAFLRALPAALDQPLPAALAAHTPPGADLGLPEAELRSLVDAAALLERGSPLGLCLRRSLARYHFLRRAGLPLVIHFGARRVPGQPSPGIAGHAWVTLHGQPYHEDGPNYRGFAVMLTYPDE
jgi:hypothetical protein